MISHKQLNYGNSSSFISMRTFRYDNIEVKFSHGFAKDSPGTPKNCQTCALSRS